MRILGLDLGTKTLGIAITDKLGLIANPLKTLRYNDYSFLIKELENIINEYKVDLIVLGYPKNMNNTIGPAAKRSIEFKTLIENMLNIEVKLVDERLSTSEAERVLIDNDTSRKDRKKVIDTVAATIILESYLNRKSE